MMSFGPTPDAMASTPPDDERTVARQRLQLRRDFSSHVVAFVVVNAFLIGIWWFTGSGYFWPAWVMGAWAIGLVLHAWEAFVRRPITEADVDAEVHRLHLRH